MARPADLDRGRLRACCRPRCCPPPARRHRRPARSRRRDLRRRATGSRPTRTSTTWPAVSPPRSPIRPGCSAASGSSASTRARTPPRRCASSYRARLTPIEPGRRPAAPRPAHHARRGDRRVRARRLLDARPPGRGRPARVAAAAAADGVTAAADDGTLLLARLPVPYDALDGTGPDGRALWQRRGRARPRRRRGSVRRGRPSPSRSTCGTRPSSPTTPTLHRRRRRRSRVAATTAATSTGGQRRRRRRPSAPTPPAASPTRTSPRAGSATRARRSPAGGRSRTREVDIGGYAAGPQPLRDAAADRPDREPVRRLVHVPRRRPAPAHVVTLDEVVVDRLVRRRLDRRAARGLEPVRHRRPRRALAGAVGHGARRRWSGRCSTRSSSASTRTPTSCGRSSRRARAGRHADTGGSRPRDPPAQSERDGPADGSRTSR